MPQIGYLKNVVLLACLYGVLKKFHPATPFLTSYLESPEFKNFTNAELYGEIYPYSTYANMFTLVFLFCFKIIYLK